MRCCAPLPLPCMPPVQTLRSSLEKKAWYQIEQDRLHQNDSDNESIGELDFQKGVTYAILNTEAVNVKFACICSVQSVDTRGQFQTHFVGGQECWHHALHLEIVHDADNLQIPKQGGWRVTAMRRRVTILWDFHFQSLKEYVRLFNRWNHLTLTAQATAEWMELEESELFLLFCGNIINRSGYLPHRVNLREESNTNYVVHPLWKVE